MRFSFRLFDQSVTGITEFSSVRLYNLNRELGWEAGYDRTSNYPIIRTGPGCDRYLHFGSERLRVLNEWFVEGHTVEKIVFLCFLVAIIVLLAELYRAPEAQAQQ